jgi:hypothetical protein
MITSYLYFHAPSDYPASYIIHIFNILLIKNTTLCPAYFPYFYLCIFLHKSLLVITIICLDSLSLFNVGNKIFFIVYCFLYDAFYPQSQQERSQFLSSLAGEARSCCLVARDAVQQLYSFDCQGQYMVGCEGAWKKGGEEAAVNGEGRAGDTGVMLKGMVDKQITISGKQTYSGKSCFLPTLF